MWAASAAAIGYSVKRIAAGKDAGLDERKIPMMGIMGAFVFAGQMINFTIPATGSSGHIGGGILLAALLGPANALVTLASVLLIQCLFFADGGLLAYGCNVFNMGVTACIGAYALVYRPIVKGGGLSARSITAASVAAVVAGLLAGSFLVVLETLASGVTELPFATFAGLMLPIHLAIGLVEGLVTAAVLCFVHRARPELLQGASGAKGEAAMPMKTVLAVFAVLTVLVGGGLSLVASSNPDGLEWSMERTAGTAELEREGPVYEAAANVVEKTAFMPDYGFRTSGDTEEEGGAAGTAAAGITGSLITVALACVLGFGINAIRRKRQGAA
jgi:cobalt/nickel transport system permease protein